MYGKFSYNSICTNIFQDEMLSPEKFLYVRKLKELIRSCQSSNSRRVRTRVRAYHAWRSSEETVVFAATPHIWQAAMGEELECDREPENSCDCYEVAVKRSGVVIAHLPRKLSRVCSLFLRCGGVISCTRTGLEIVQYRHGNYYSSSIDRTSIRTVSNIHVHVHVRM